MRIVVTGASGNVGTGVLRALAKEPDTEVVGVCRRPPAGGAPYDGVEWHAVDLGAPDAAQRLAPALAGAAAVVHLAWAIQPVRDEEYLHRVNVGGTRAVLRAIAAAGVEQLVYASTLGVYAPGASEPVTETWPDSGQRTSVYSRHKVVLERLLDRFELDRPDVAVSRIRPTLVVQRGAATGIRALFLGPLVPRPLLALMRRRALPLLPLPRGTALQFVHADDVGDAVVRLLARPIDRARARGAYNLAADGLDVRALAGLVGARPVVLGRGAVRAVVAALHAVRAVPVSPGWYDIAMNTPLMDTTRARDELGWAPTRTSTQGAQELLDGLAEGVAGGSAALGARSGGG